MSWRVPGDGWELAGGGRVVDGWWGQEELFLWTWGSRQTWCRPRSCQLEQRVHPAEATEGELELRKPQATATAFVSAMCQTVAHLLKDSLTFGILAPCAHAGCEGTSMKIVNYP